MSNEIRLCNNDETYSEFVDVISAFEVPKLKNKYIIYSKNEKDINDNTIIYLGKITESNNDQYIESIYDEEEWEQLKDILKLISKYSLEGEENV